MEDFCRGHFGKSHCQMKKQTHWRSFEIKVLRRVSFIVQAGKAKIPNFIRLPCTRMKPRTQPSHSIGSKSLIG